MEILYVAMYCKNKGPGRDVLGNRPLSILYNRKRIAKIKYLYEALIVFCLLNIIFKS